MQANYTNALCHLNATLLNKAKMWQCLGGGLLSLSLSLSLSRCSHFLASLWAKFKGLFTHFVVVSSYLVANFSYFIVVLTHLFTCKRHFLGHYAFLKFSNALFMRFCALFVILSVATQRVAGRKPQQKNPHKLKENLPFLDTSLTLSMTNSGFCLKTTDKENALCHFAMTARQKFKFFTQNSKHFINSTHFITLSQILSLTQGFFIFLPHIFYIFTQIAFKILKNSTQGVHYEQ